MPHLENTSTALEMSLEPSPVLVFRKTAQDLSRQKGQRPSRVLVRTKTCVAEDTKNAGPYMDPKMENQGSEH